MKRVVVFGTFDIIHRGHLWFLEQAKRQGNELVVVVARDARVKAQKGLPHWRERDRLSVIAALRVVDRVVLGDPPGHWRMIVRLKPAVICVGYDQKVSPAVHAQLQTLKPTPRVVRIRALRPSQYRSSRIKSFL